MLDDSLTESDSEEDAFQPAQLHTRKLTTAKGMEVKSQTMSSLSSQMGKRNLVSDSDTEYSDDDDDFDVFVST